MIVIEPSQYMSSQ